VSGLGELYEAEYLKKALGLENDEQEQKQKETLKLFDTLCDKLNALSNFHFTPKRASQELEVRQCSWMYLGLDAFRVTSISYSFSGCSVAPVSRDGRENPFSRQLVRSSSPWRSLQKEDWSGCCTARCHRNVTRRKGTLLFRLYASALFLVLEISRCGFFRAGKPAPSA